MSEHTTSLEGKRTQGVIPPPLIYGCALLIGLGLDWLWPNPVLPVPAQYWVGGIVIALSGVLLAAVLREFFRAKTSFSPNSPSSALIRSGPLRYSRNPAYVSLSMLYFGFGIVVDSVWIFGLGVVAVLITHYAVILREEAYLERKFGDEYRAYMAEVRRWI